MWEGHPSALEERRRAEGQSLTLEVTVPVNATALVHVPAVSPERVREGGRIAGQAPGVNFVRAEDGYALYQVPSGSYVFQVR